MDKIYMTSSREFLFSPGQNVRVIVCGLDYRGQVNVCRWSRNSNTYEVEYSRDGVIVEGTFYADQLSLEKS